MRVNVPQNIVTRNIDAYSKNNTCFIPKSMKPDFFVPSFSSDSGESFISRLKKFMGIGIYTPVAQISNEKPSEFHVDLAKGVEKHMEKTIPPQNLKNILSANDIRNLLPTLSEQNFVYSLDTFDKDTFCVDLDYQTNFSKGKYDIFDTLDKVAKFADKQFEKTGKDFVFAITDRDSLMGIQHAIRIVGENPEKFKHVKIVPGVKITYSHQAPKSGIGYENSEMLVYGINPFSKNLIAFLDNIVMKRKMMTLEFIRKVNNVYPEFAYDILEFSEQNGLKYSKDYTVSNLYWRAREYAETKGDFSIKSSTMVPENIVSEATKILDTLDELVLGSDNEIFYSSKNSKIINNDEDLNHTIKTIFKSYSTHKDEETGSVVSSAENLFDEMIDCLYAEKNMPVLAFCAPYYLSHHFQPEKPLDYKEVVEFMNNAKAKSKGMIIAFESVVPSYGLDKKLDMDSVDEFNDYIRKNTELYEVGASFSRNI